MESSPGTMWDLLSISLAAMFMFGCKLLLGRKCNVCVNIKVLKEVVSVLLQ